MMKQAQTFIEYILMISAVTAIMLLMSTMVKRGVQGMVKTVADQVGFQNESDQIEQGGGFVMGMRQTSSVQKAIGVRDRLGNIVYTYDTDLVETQRTVLTNSGLIED